GDEVGEQRHDVAVPETPLTVVLSGPITNADARLVQLLQSFRQLGDGMLVLHTRGITGAWFGIVREFLLHQSFNTALGPLPHRVLEGFDHFPEETVDRGDVKEIIPTDVLSDLLHRVVCVGDTGDPTPLPPQAGPVLVTDRSEERRGGKKGRPRWRAAL